MKQYATQVIVGAQWGDEGKGKIADFLAQKADLVVRYQGGNNAGHSIVIGQKRYALNHIPSGIFNAHTKNILAQGMVINPPMLIDEIAALKAQGLDHLKLYISDRAHIILPYHLALDGAFETLKASVDITKAIGTTKKGIGPAYEDKAARIGIRMIDFINPEVFKAKLADVLLIKNKTLAAFNLATYSVEVLLEEYQAYAKALKPFVTDTALLLTNELNAGKTALFEGAQGVMLCLDNGTYPYVTSSSPTASAVPLGTGLNFRYLNRVTGVVKAYVTRVGAGALPTEILDDLPLNALIRERGHEYGTVTKRPRRIGWLDTVALRHATRVSGFSDLAVTLLDVLDFADEIKICYAYELDGKEIDYVPSSDVAYLRVKPKYLTMPGWKSNITNVRKYQDLPKNAQTYLNKIGELVGVEVKMFSVGPDRSQTVLVG